MFHFLFFCWKRSPLQNEVHPPIEGNTFRGMSCLVFCTIRELSSGGINEDLIVFS